MKAYAEKADLEAHLPSDMTLPSDPEVDRLLLKASGRIDRMIRVSFDFDVTDQLPTDADVAEVINKATCQQVVYMLKVGEDIEGLSGTQISTGSFSGVLPSRYSVDAFETLLNAGLIK